MLLYEFEGKKIFSRAGMHTPDSILISSKDEIEKGVERIGGFPVMIKAQVLTGGRGKAGLVQAASDPSEARKKAADIFQLLSSIQTDNPIKSVMIERKMKVTQEIYLGITIDRIAKKPLIIGCTEGGIEIEQVAKDSPEKISSIHVAPLRGLRFYEAIRLAQQMGLKGKALSNVSNVIFKLYKVFEDNDAELAEINPLILTPDNQAYALDSKIILNDDALFRHPDISEIHRDLAPIEKEAKKLGLTYVDLQPGNVAVISSGAGYTLMVLDLIRSFGGEPANFMDSIVDSREKMQSAIEFIVNRAKEDSNIQSILMLKTMSFTPLDRIMGAIEDALKDIKVPVPIISCLRATGNAVRNMTMKEAERKLADLGVDQYSSLREAVKAAVDVAKGKVR
ncbi:succinate--CoA ligase [ADP-forming] subunit beta [Desulfosarcina widdelii]|uniref:Succinate--CoA ligase [ADP-forming] subunit beta n=1 Tax=Desulfosarcina widdelii TaxID=947919 RepID=A0A5K7YVE5_9BACT|nr:ATP-grasp domain-containing protein [Desulfosarcina widdelii]BBO72628.1 succinate--CoA ligase [ADP-forming] subunit beta [Desulfosarcina widdelii]